MNLSSEVAQLIRQERGKKELGQNELAHKAGINQGHLSQIENEKRGVSLEQLERIASALGKRVRVRFVRGKR